MVYNGIFDESSLVWGLVYSPPPNFDTKKAGAGRSHVSGEWLVFCAKICCWLALKFSVVPSSLCLGSSVGLVYSIATERCPCFLLG